MSPLRARVKNGRLVLDEPTELPEGTIVELVPNRSPASDEVELVVEDRDDLDEEDRARLHAALDRADDELRAGKGIPGGAIIAALRAGKL